MVAVGHACADGHGMLVLQGGDGVAVGAEGRRGFEVDGHALLLWCIDAGECGGGFGVAWREGGFQLHVVAGHVRRGVARSSRRTPVDRVEDPCRIEG